ncbi:MAG: hypothetical protein ABH808_01185 [Candidatus Kuenenbacteria bacterium]
MKKILIFGDSIAWGAFDYSHGGLAERLRKKYFQTYKSHKSETHISVYNLSIVVLFSIHLFLT